jgi:hypothetical protein
MCGEITLVLAGNRFTNTTNIVNAGFLTTGGFRLLPHCLFSSTCRVGVLAHHEDESVGDNTHSTKGSRFQYNAIQEYHEEYISENKADPPAAQMA